MGYGSGNAHRLTMEERLELERRVRSGESHAAAAKAVGCSAKSVQRLLRRSGGVKSRTGAGSAARLSLAEREEISRGVRTGESCRVIAMRLRRAPSTVSREIARAAGRERYRAWIGEQRAWKRRRRPKVPKLVACRRLRAKVESLLSQRWSPQQISARLVMDNPADLEMRVSHETIYQSLFVQGRGALRRELTKCLRTGRAQRRPHGRVPGAGRLRDMVLISERPADADDRAVPGHWEGDLVFGKLATSAIATLVERQTRFVLIIKLNEGRLAEHVRKAISERILALPEQLRRSLTWDQGKEMAEHVQFTIDTGVQVYFCNPSSPWQRGTNENTNGLLRQYFPRRDTDFTTYDQECLDEVAAQLNARPRQTLGWRTPAEDFARVVAMTT